MATSTDPCDTITNSAVLARIDNSHDSEQAGTGIDEDNISLTSTVESEFQDEYEVETIYAQEVRNGEDMYLVKWEGYSDLRCTWEPKKSFKTSDILREWKETKRDIKTGLRTAFDVTAWETDLEAFVNAKEDRKRRRSEKRARLHLLSGITQERQKKMSEKEPEGQDLDESSSSGEGEPLIATRKRMQKDLQRFDNTQPGRLSQFHNKNMSAKSQPQNHTPETSTIRTDSATAKLTKRSRTETSKPVAMTVQEGRTQRKDLASVLRRTRQQQNSSTDKSQTWKLFSTTYKFGKASQQDPEPNKDDLELQNPKAFTPFQMPSYPRRLKPVDDEGLFVEQDEIPETQFNTLQSPITSTSSPVLNSGQSNAADFFSERSSVDNIVEDTRKNLSAKEPSFVSKPPTDSQSRGPTTRKRKLRVQSDVICQISYGPGAVEIGDAQICGLAGIVRQAVIKLKDMDKVELRIRFQELCTLDQYPALLDKEILSNGYIYAYPDTQTGLLNMEELLLKDDLVGIARICHIPSFPDQGYTLLCYPTRTKSFQFLNKNGYKAPGRSVHIAVIHGILPTCWPEPQPDIESTEATPKPDRPERQGRFDKADKSEMEGMLSWRFPSQIDASSLEVPSSDRGNSILSKDQTATAPRGPQVDTPVISPSIDQKEAFDPSNETDTDTYTFHSLSDEDKMDISHPQTTLSEASNTSLSIDRMSNMTPSLQTIPDSQDVQMVDINDLQNIDIKDLLKNTFHKHFGINFNDIAAITSHSSLKHTNCFYLWFPESADAEFQILEKFLEDNFAIVLSNRRQHDWEKFTKSPTGVVLFHYSFLQYHELPGFHKLTMSSSFNFWNVSLSHGLPDLETETHFQRLFPQGTGYLMTEDFMLRQRDAAIVILAWFRETAISKFPGTVKMMFRPDILRWLDHMSEEDPRFTVMAILIGDTACHNEPLNWPVEARDLDYFQNPSLQSPVISLADMPKLASPDGKTPQQRKEQEADLLCDVFAAWTILNAASLRKFHIITHNTPQARWQEWQHIEIIQGANECFRRWNINKDNYTRWLAKSGTLESLSLPLPLPSAANSSKTTASSNSESQKAGSPKLAGRKTSL